ncbi:MAG TPA: roadblock/LC7 domain-containing protein [Gemmatimonadales bacterium]|nr:roadblock/LC7 domain-containing protein [Gemmatimonadales bacterium]
MSPSYSSLLEALTRLRGIRGAMVVEAADGIAVAEELMGGLKGTALAALAANLAARAAELSGRGGFGMPRFLHLQATDGSLLIAPASRNLVLVAVAARDVPLGLLRLEMLRMAEHLV